MRLLALKHRHWSKGLILVAADFAQLAAYIEVPSNNALKRATATWPGPATWIFPAAARTPMWITGDHDGIAIRVTSHPVLRALSRSEEHTSELQSLMRISYAVFCLKKKKRA